MTDPNQQNRPDPREERRDNQGQDQFDGGKANRRQHEQEQGRPDQQPKPARRDDEKRDERPGQR